PFYVYGTLPLFLVRSIYEWLPPRTASITLLGRYLAALADLFTIVVLYFLVARLYGRHTALLATLFSALAVMQIQQSHFFTVDSFMTPFLSLALYCAARIAYGRPPPWIDLDNREASLSSLTRDPVFWTSIGFGLALGLAASCKLTALALAVVLPAALT